jgi:Calcineurin-like phosphoesterase
LNGVTRAGTERLEALASTFGQSWPYAPRSTRRGTSMRVAVLNDIHGNLPALDAVLAEVDRADVDAIVVGGDLVWGPMPVCSAQQE